MSDPENISFATICERLGLTAAQLRDVISSFGDILGAGEADQPPPDDEVTWRELLDGDAESEGTPGLPRESLQKIEKIVRMRADGIPDAEIRRILLDAEASASSAEERLALNLDRLAREIELTEKRRAEDRDRLLTALMRTHQEVRQLRNELAAQSSRRARKKRSILSRLLGL
ncbi:MAG: hypothetical protein NUV93_07230 [Firmicutes bacterium]|jgi:hypothetical protein|nr:hypothetical protein [Bacillota bacterium]